MLRLAHATLLAFVAFLFCVAPAHAGGGPETVLVVVNAESPASVEVANAYATLRDIPPTHVFHLEGVPHQPVIDIATFRERILKPIEAYLDAQGMAEDIDTIAYSVGFPYGVNFDAEAKPRSSPFGPRCRARRRSPDSRSSTETCWPRTPRVT